MHVPPTNMRLILNLQGVRLRQSKLQLHSRLRAARCNPIDTVGLYSLPVRSFAPVSLAKSSAALNRAQSLG